MRRNALALSLLAALAVAGCGQSTGLQVGAPGAGGTPVAGFPYLATKNTTRVASTNAATTAAAVALAVFPGGGSSPQTVALADAGDWRAALVASVLMAPPLRAPLLLSDAGSLPPPTATALNRMRPSLVIRVGAAAAQPGTLKRAQLTGPDPYTLAANVATYAASLQHNPSSSVVVVSAQDPAFAMPAAAWAAKSGDPILFVTQNTLPTATAAAISHLTEPHIYVLGPGTVIGGGVVTALGKLGTVTRIAGGDPVSNAIAFARYSDSTFGWGVVNPGHGLVFSRYTSPVDAGAVAALSASGTYGPLLLLSSATTLPASLYEYLLTIEPGYAGDPSRGVYNHGWLIGDGNAISQTVQARIDTVLEIAPVSTTPPTTTTTGP